MNPLQQIAAAVTPAVMVSACGLIALGLDNQTARMATRLRELAREWRELGESAPRRTLVAQQVRGFDHRHELYYRALLLNYGALFSFVVTSLLWLLQAVWDLPAGLPLVVFGVGVVMLAGMALLVIASIMSARSIIRSEAEEILREAPDAIGPAGAGR